MSDLDAAQDKVAEADAAARELLLSSEKQLEQQFKERIEELKRKGRVRLSPRIRFCCDHHYAAGDR